MYKKSGVIPELESRGLCYILDRQSMATTTLSIINWIDDENIND